ncbi:NAD(P)-binding protein [Artomyces pyxidatus]|uniref:NAD(P)-binding protein n=1 Tax=Artomyces pyxidatus TaxID=48021 RepID=A0ACB8T4S3_9AGAM|nr:NAD(P)-binding protein [Artomyces pyxidatus]
MASKVVIVGGHGKVALRLAALLSPTHAVTSIIRTPDHIPDIAAASPSITPLVLSLEDASVADLAGAFAGAEVVVFSAGAGGKGGPDRTRKVDYEGAVKVFDAIEAVPGAKPRLLLVSSIDVRNPDQIPPHYTEDDIKYSHRVREAIGTYIHYKYEADKELARRTEFKWTILRPTLLTDTPGTGRAAIGKTHIEPSVSRNDVALVLQLLVGRPDAAGLAIDLSGGDIPVAEGLDAFIKKGETDFLE